MPRIGFQGGAALSFNRARVCFTFLLLTLRIIIIAPIAMSDMHDFASSNSAIIGCNNCRRTAILPNMTGCVCFL